MTTTETPPARVLRVPEPSLVVLIGASGAGKSTFARTHFLATEIVSSDWARGVVCDDENSLTHNADAFEVVHFLAGKRLTNMRLTVVDATNVQRDARKPLVQLARDHDLLPVAIVLDVPEAVCVERNAARPDRADMGRHVVRGHVRALRRSLKHLRREGFRHVHVVTPDELDRVRIERTPLYSDKRDETGPFDLVGDVHGCHDELVELLERLGYAVEPIDGADPWSAPDYGLRLVAPEGRRLCFVGDLVDRGPRTPDVLRLVMSAVAAGTALCVPGNHDVKLARALRGRKVRIAHGLQDSLDQLAEAPEAFREAVVGFVESLISHLVLDAGRLCVAHAGMKAEYQGRASRRVRDFALYGETTGEVDGMGLPVRLDWASEYRGDALVVYGHTPVTAPRWHNDTICIDTGCVFGGALTALRYPERELVSVDAHETWCESVVPLGESPRGAEAVPHDQLDLADVLGRRTVTTGLRPRITVPEDGMSAALEVVSRFAVDPRWLIYLPPTMSSCETSGAPGLLEHPDEALAYYRNRGVTEVICQEKHMGSRAVVVVCRDEEAARARFGGLCMGQAGVVYSRTGRPFFGADTAGAARMGAVLERVRAAADAAGLFELLQTDWLCLDCELMPWSAKASSLVREQYASVGAAARGGLSAAVAALEQAAGRGVEGCDALLATMRARRADADAFSAAWRPYCWPVAEAPTDLTGLRLAPFHLMASGSTTHLDRDHVWHMRLLSRLANADATGLLTTTDHRLVHLDDEAGCASLVEWWRTLTGSGGEGVIVKPRSFLARDDRGRLVQPAIKCRGPEYLRIIYGPSYDRPEHLERLRQRGVGRKRSRALRELALGVEGLERFVAGRPLREVHETVLAVLAQG